MMAVPKPKLARDRAVRFRAATLPGERRRTVQWIDRLRFQLLGGLLFAIWLPAMVRWPSARFIPSSAAHDVFVYSLIGTVAALLLGFVGIRQLISFPGAQPTVFIFPSFAIAYVAVIVVFFFFRIDYSRYQFAASFTMANVWYYAVYLIRQTLVRPKLAVVTAGDIRNLTDIEGVDWVPLDTPAFPGEHFDSIVADLRADLSPEWERFLADAVLKGIPVYHTKQIAESLTGRVEIEHLSENSFGAVLPSLLYLRLKRLFDLALALLLTPLFAVVIALAALAVRLDSAGPVFFRQARMGFRGEPFTMVKLRTMQPDAAKLGHFTTDNDPRITRIGHLLRKFRIDELPQIVNVIKGEMSWIGPRPEAVELSRWYASEIPFYVYRHAVRPGITGWAQVNQGNVAQVEAATYKLHYDFYYIKHFSPWLDALITAKTIRTILTGFGSK